MDPTTIRVHAPTSIFFLCGGEAEPGRLPPRTLREAFTTVLATGGLGPHKLILAEAANPLSLEAGYSDLLSFETDLSQIVSLILLFSESAGSLAEMGAFSVVKPIAKRLLVVIEEPYYNAASFIKNGPLTLLERTYGEECVLVIDRAELGIGDDGNCAGVNVPLLGERVLPAAIARLEALHEFDKFDPKNNGHIIMLMTGLSQQYGALTITEIQQKLAALGVAVTIPALSKLIYCAIFVDWIKKIKKGNHTYYVALPVGTAIDFSFKRPKRIAKGTHKKFDKVKWRSDIRAYWIASDPPRARAITEVLAMHAAPKVAP